MREKETQDYEQPERDYQSRIKNTAQDLPVGKDRDIPQVQQQMRRQEDLLIGLEKICAELSERLQCALRNAIPEPVKENTVSPYLCPLAQALFTNNEKLADRMEILSDFLERLEL